jgi:hypothetical protein
MLNFQTGLIQLCVKKTQVVQVAWCTENVLGGVDDNVDLLDTMEE